MKTAVHIPGESGGKPSIAPPLVSVDRGFPTPASRSLARDPCDLAPRRTALGSPQQEKRQNVRVAARGSLESKCLPLPAPPVVSSAMTGAADTARPSPQPEKCPRTNAARAHTDAAGAAAHPATTVSGNWPQLAGKRWKWKALPSAPEQAGDYPPPGTLQSEDGSATVSGVQAYVTPQICRLKTATGCSCTSTAAVACCRRQQLNRTRHIAGFGPSRR